MDTSDWIAAGAAVTAVAALVLGEIRASSARRARSERNIVDWLLDWPGRDAFVLTSSGPDEARRVLVKLTTEGVSVEVEAKRVRRGDTISIPVAHLNAIWDEVARQKGNEYRRLNVVAYGLRITWVSPLGKPGILETTNFIQKDVPYYGIEIASPIIPV